MDGPSGRPRVRWYHYVGAATGSPIYAFLLVVAGAWLLAPVLFLALGVWAAFHGEWALALTAVFVAIPMWMLYNWVHKSMSGPPVNEVDAEAMRQEQMARWRRPKGQQRLPPSR